MKKLLGAYVSVGLFAFAVSFLFELIMLFSFTGSLLLAAALTTVLEGSKLLLTIFHRSIEEKKHQVTDTVRFLGLSFRFGLVFISVLCSLAYFSSSLDRPNLEQVMAEDKARVNTGYDEKIAMLNAQRQERLETIRGEIKERYRVRNQELDEFYKPKIAELESKRTREFDRVVGGVRKGPYWFEFDRQIQELKSEFKEGKDRLTASEDEEMNQYVPGIEAEFQNKLEKVMNDKDSALTGISTNNYELDDRAKNRHIVSLLATLDKGLGIHISYLAFSMLLSILTSLLLELAIYLAFNYIVMYKNAIETTAKAEPVYEIESDAEPATGGIAEAGDGRGGPAGVQGMSDNPFSNGMAEPDIDPATYEFLKNLNAQYGAHEGGRDADPENPCG